MNPLHGMSQPHNHIVDKRIGGRGDGGGGRKSMGGGGGGKSVQSDMSQMPGRVLKKLSTWKKYESSPHTGKRTQRMPKIHATVSEMTRRRST